MKTRKWLSLFLATTTILCFSSCYDWGDWDDPAGNQVYPTLQLLKEYAFESLDETDLELLELEGGQLPEIVRDDSLGNVLHLNGGYTRLENPVRKVKLQAGNSLTFWVKLPETDPQGTIFSFANDDNTSLLSFSGEGKVSYRSPAESYTSGKASPEGIFLTPGEWHYLAILFTSTGYQIYKNGEIAINLVTADFDFTKVRDFLMTDATWFYLGYDDASPLKEFWIDDLKIYRNLITSRQISVPKVTRPGDDFEYRFPPLNTVGYYLLDGSFTNSLNAVQGGEFVTVETQATTSGFETDATRGIVWHQQEGWAGHANGWAYTRFDNPLKGVELTDEGLTVVMWINPPWINWWDQIFVLNDGVNKFWFNALGYVGYNGVGGWFDCQKENNSNEMAAGQWTMFTLVLKPDEFTVYYNNEVKFTNTHNGMYDYMDLTSYENVLNMFTTADNFYFGYESWWKAAPALIDDVLLISRPVSAKEVEYIYRDTKKSDGGTVDDPSYIPETTIAHYPLDGNFSNSKNVTQSGEFVTVEKQTTLSAFETDATRGVVWHQQEGWAGHANGWAYTRFDNPLKGVELVDDGLTVSMWINPPWINWWDQIFVLNDGVSKFWFNALGYVGYNGVGGWFDCHKDNNSNEMTPGKWTLFTLVLTTDDFTVYYDDEVKFTSTHNGMYDYKDLTSYENVLNMFTTADNFYFGYESWWKAAPALIDDLYLCKSPLTATQVKALYDGTRK